MPLWGRATGDYREYADRASFDVAEITISCWVKWNSTGASQRAICRGTLAAGGQWHYGTTGGGSHFFAVHNGASAVVAGSGALPAVGSWMHIMGTYQVADGNVRFYVNGALIASIADTTAMGASNTAIRFFETTGGASHANVSLSHFGLWSKLLTADDRAALYAGANPATIRPDALVICDQLDNHTSIDTAGMVAPTDAGNLVATPKDFPWQRDYIDPVPGPRNIKRRRRAVAAAGGAQSPLLLRLHNERLFTGGFA